MITRLCRNLIHTFNTYWYNFFTQLAVVSEYVASNIPHKQEDCVLDHCHYCDTLHNGVISKPDLEGRHCQRADHAYYYEVTCDDCWEDLKGSGLTIKGSGLTKGPIIRRNLEPREIDQERLPDIDFTCPIHLKQYYAGCVDCDYDQRAVIKAYDSILDQQKAERRASLQEQAQSTK